jgi:dTDP-4-dehydrorhamnose reductase
MKVLILGVTGMLGSAVFKCCTSDQELTAWGTIRSASAKKFFPINVHQQLIENVDVLDNDSLIHVMNEIKPDVVINCVGLIKHLTNAGDPLAVLPLNAMLPHRLSLLCALAGARLIHISTDCVFSGRKGMYTEDDISDAEDLYGKSKYIGELRGSSHAVTLRTSIIGHELNSQTSLIDWFLAQSGTVNGFTKAIFSGLPTIELARIIKDVVIPNPKLSGLYNVSASPIDKYSLLKLVAATYGKKVEIIPTEQLIIDRSLDSTRFKTITEYSPETWERLVQDMFMSYQGNKS